MYIQARLFFFINFFRLQSVKYLSQINSLNVTLFMIKNENYSLMFYSSLLIVPLLLNIQANKRYTGKHLLFIQRLKKKYYILDPLLHGQFYRQKNKSPLRGGKTKFLHFFFIVASATKSQEFSGIGCLQIFLVKGKKHSRGENRVNGEQG